MGLAKYIHLLKVSMVAILSGAVLSGTVSCTGGDNDAYPSDAGEAVVNISVSATSTGINEDTRLWEDRVTEIRIIVFDRSGKALRNMMLDFPNGFNAPSEPITMQTGTFSFYFIANETAGDSDFQTALKDITDVSQFGTDSRFRNLEYDPDFVPDGTTSAGRFLMSAVYDDIVVTSGGTQAAPARLDLPTTTVELVRAMAKVEIVFRKKVSGGNVPDGTVSSVQLQNLTRNFSVPPIDVIPRAPLFLDSNSVTPDGFDYSRDSIGAVTFYIPELLRINTSTLSTYIAINDKFFQLHGDFTFSGLAKQRRTVSDLSQYSVIRNYNYRINAFINSEGGVVLETSVEPWVKTAYTYMFQDPDLTLVLPPVEDTPGGIIFPTTCGTIELLHTNEALSCGLQGAYGDQIIWYDPVTQGPRVQRGDPPYYCEKKYGPGYRLINACELMSFLAAFDQAYRVWQSNTWQGIDSKLPFYPASLRLQSQHLLEQLTGQDLSMYTPADSAVDPFGGMKLGIIDDFFTPGDIEPTVNQYPDGWPFPSPPATGIEPWYPMETVTQVKAYWYSGYLEYSVPANHDKILYQQFTRYSYSSTISRCVREIN